MKSKEEENMQRLKDCLQKGRNCKLTNLWFEEKKKNKKKKTFLSIQRGLATKIEIMRKLNF